MSRAFVKDDNEDRPSEELPERPVSDAPNYVTAEGMQLLRQRVEELAREHARLRESAEAFEKPQLAVNERDLRYFQSRLESAILVDVASEPKDEVHFGATVKTQDEDGKISSFTIVGEDEADVKKNKISWVSPLAKALLGSRVGDTVTWNRPAGSTTLEVLDISYLD
ncbi:MAG: GreA/GreB family elongation factor [Betaproteobacteria bacterium]|jgi:transcription elongation GreA/GreB family factor|nr:MAG: GreA/GreB family elongation factor [Betaproteobacteria bacterium]